MKIQIDGVLGFWGFGVLYFESIENLPSEFLFRKKLNLKCMVTGC